MRRLPSLNALRFFDSAARQASFTLAAKELCVTHSAVSQQIRQLEEWLGCALFERRAGRVHLTAAGLDLQRAAHDAFDLLERRCDELRRGTQPAELAVGAPASFLSNWLIPRLEQFEALHPDIRIRLQTAADAALLNTQRVDALILAGRAWPQEWGVTPLFAETIGPVCTPTLAAHIRDAADVLDMPLLHTSSRPDAWKDWAARQGIALTPRQAGREFDHLGHMLEAAAAGLGVAIAPAVLVEAELHRGRLAAPLGFIESGAAFSLCLRKDAVRADAAHERLRDWLLASAGAN
ncbi:MULTISPECIES: LysR substrate-binding domain-containing protein [Achromobacter]|jgi:DNA-binding transcriptional LysR family regulator|uniref:LysR substrate-binding domain-containing protein n=1 Tax=Achromobacter aegrifaciens TaxID=1287736 RepID=A0ABU2DHG3_ACHAE|nr:MULTISPECIES: LysR substrate-binding domain-containing protein [Achromobacter]MBD9382290.1 LysR family transcriptional regulator [Achromobacter sp. ACM02]MBD9430875.1 LysR family transcriptional regulator [Achromobacter sp. ACM03]MDQ1762008.1 LysR substrate-binding domain-containing protein [Achromobacter aegrifaciens]MDR7947533.1 LysR substrate-binding domain-containing protein [Achromobacter aegrifaciens]RSF03798.1 LysR family transcriptional regulator [Achromobacter aegrifaciens]